MRKYETIAKENQLLYDQMENIALQLHLIKQRIQENLDEIERGWDQDCKRLSKLTKRQQNRIKRQMQPKQESTRFTKKEIEAMRKDRSDPI